MLYYPWLTTNLDVDELLAKEGLDFVDRIKNHKVSTVNTPEASLLSCRIAFCEKESADKRTKVNL